MHKNSQSKSESSISIAKIQNILKLQQLFHNKFLTIELLHELISLYTACIESIDEEHQELRVYFLQKIQFVLSRTQTQTMLNKVNAMEKNSSIGNSRIIDNLRQTLRITEASQLEMQAKMQILTPNINKKRLYNYDGDKPDEKKKKINIQIQLMNQMQNNMKNITTQVQNADIKQKISDKMITQITTQQNHELQQRLAMRKNKRNKKPRKKSFDQKDNIQDQQNPVILKKQQLIKVQQQIHNAVVRMTIRNTQRLYQQEKKIKNQNRKQGTTIRELKRINRQQSSEDQ